MINRIKYLLFVFVFTVACIEIFLRIAGWQRDYNEHMGNGYVSPYTSPNDKGWYHINTANDTFTTNNGDYQYQVITNALGLRERNYPRHKTDSTIRILVTGDSFAQGVGAPYDSTWPRLLEKYLREKNIPAEVIDAGIAGSDIIYDYVLYRDKLKDYHPDIVIASMNCSDYIDYYYRGGMERFRADSQVHYRNPPIREYLFHYSFIYRYFNQMRDQPFLGVYLTTPEFIPFVALANKDFSGVIANYNNAAQKNGSKFIFLIHRVPTEILFGEGGVNAIIRNGFIELNSTVKKRGAQTLDISEGLSARLKNKPWPYFTYEHDKHFNGTGYNVIAGLVGDSLMARSELLQIYTTGGWQK